MCSFSSNFKKQFFKNKLKNTPSIVYNTNVSKISSKSKRVNSNYLYNSLTQMCVMVVNVPAIIYLLINMIFFMENLALDSRSV